MCAVLQLPSNCLDLTATVDFRGQRDCQIPRQITEASMSCRNEDGVTVKSRVVVANKMDRIAIREKTP